MCTPLHQVSSHKVQQWRRQAVTMEQFVFDCVDVGTEEVATSTTVNTAALDETDAILQDCSSHAPAVLSTKWQNIEKAKQQWNAICAETKNDENAKIAATVCQHLVRSKSLVAALKTKPALGQVQKPREPANKKVIPQRYYALTKTKPKKRKAEETLSEPDRKQRAFLLSSMSGQSELVSRHGIQQWSRLPCHS